MFPRQQLHYSRNAFTLQSMPMYFKQEKVVVSGVEWSGVECVGLLVRL
jgi:hypothetical protein